MKKLDPKVVTLAIDIAEQLNDTKSLSEFIKMCQKYKESYLREQLEKVLKIPRTKIRVSRGAYFTFLVNSCYDKNSTRP